MPGAATFGELIRLANKRNIVAQILVEICKTQQELQQLLFLAVGVVAGSVGEKLDGEFGLHMELIERFFLNRMAFAAKGRSGLQLMHGAFEVVFEAQRFLCERRGHCGSASRDAARKSGYYSQNALLNTVLPLTIEQSVGQTMHRDRICSQRI
jgi:hypothetical protein